MDEETLVAFGGAVKSLADGKVGGYLVRFSSPDDPDLEGDYFDASTDFGDVDGRTTDVWFNHRYPVRTAAGDALTVGDPIGKGTLTKDEHGIFIEAVLNERERYEALLDNLGWSSGTAPHLVDVEAVGKANHITRWPLGLDASMTPTPAEPRTAVVPLKTLIPDAEPEAATEADQGRPAVVAVRATEPEPTTEAVTPSTEDTDMGENTFDQEALVTGITAGVADAMTKAMQEMFDKMQPEAKGGFTVDDAVEELEGTKSFGDFLLSVKRRDRRRLAKVYGATKDMVEQTGAEGGYLVPTEYLAELIEAPEPFVEVVYPRARKIRGQRRSVQVPALDQTGAFAAAGKPNYFGGLLSYWTEEAAAKTETEPDFKQIELVAHKLAGYTQASDELLDDSALGLDQMLRQLFAGAVKWRRDYAYINGTGAGQPLGILNAPALLTTARDVANQISANDLHSLLTIFMPSSIGKSTSAWVINQTCMEQVLALSDGTNYIWQPNAQQGIPPMLYGMPVIWSEKNPALGTTGDVMLCDFSYYWIYERGGLAIDMSEDYAFINDLTTWRFVYRTDGQPSLTDQIYIDTTNQISPFVTLLNTTD